MFRHLFFCLCVYISPARTFGVTRLEFEVLPLICTSRHFTISGAIAERENREWEGEREREDEETMIE